MKITLPCSACKKNRVTDCDGQRGVDARDGRIMCFDCRSKSMGINKLEHGEDE